MSLTKEQAQAYQERYQLVNAIEVDELRALTPEESFRQTILLMAAARSLGWESRMHEDESVRATWIRLKAGV